MRAKPNGWALESYIAHNEAMRESQRYYQGKIEALELRIQEKQDRRYREVGDEHEKAVKIKEAADAQALQLARDIQTYKDKQANELREQIASERGLYATKDDLHAATDKIESKLQSALDYIALDRGRSAGTTSSRELAAWFLGIVASAILIGTFVFRGSTAPQYIMVPAPSGTMLPATPPQATPR